MSRQQRRDPSARRVQDFANFPNQENVVLRGVYGGPQLPRLRRSDLPDAALAHGDVYRLETTGVAIMDRNWSVEEHQLEVVAPDAWLDIVENFKPRFSSPTRSIVSSMYSTTHQSRGEVEYSTRYDSTGTHTHSSVSQRAPRMRQVSSYQRTPHQGSSSIRRSFNGMIGDYDDDDDDFDDDYEESNDGEEDDELITLICDRAAKDVNDAIRRGGCFVFTDGYLASHPDGDISRITELYERFHNDWYGDQDAIISLISNREGTPQRTEMLLREAMQLKRPIFRIKRAEKVYGAAAYSPLMPPTQDEVMVASPQEVEELPDHEVVPQEDQDQFEEHGDVHQRRLRDRNKRAAQLKDSRLYARNSIFQALNDLDLSSSSVDLSDVTVGVVSSVSALDLHSPHDVNEPPVRGFSSAS